MCYIEYNKTNAILYAMIKETDSGLPSCCTAMYCWTQCPAVDTTGCYIYE